MLDFHSLTSIKITGRIHLMYKSWVPRYQQNLIYSSQLLYVTYHRHIWITFWNFNYKNFIACFFVQLNDLGSCKEKVNNDGLRAQIMAAQLEQMTNDQAFDDLKFKQIGGPYTRGMTLEQRKKFLNTNLNKKAREGFRFWVTDPPKPTKCEFVCLLTMNTDCLEFLYEYKKGKYGEKV